jgi:hypothetical protein
MCLALVASAGTAAGEQDGGAGQRGPARATVNLESVAQWLQGLYSQEELRALAPQEVGLESWQCSCYDQPTRHYPYLAVVLTTPKGDLVLRPDQRDLHVNFVSIALRQGDLYCDVDAGSDCFGRFASVCHFTDFRYGEDLAPYFPTCKSDEP